jgi:serpin B
MGMTDAFDGTAADFTGLVNPEPAMPTCCPPRIAIADVLQEATFAVQESGVEAAAATAVILGSSYSSGCPPTVTPMNVNKPFLFSVVDATGAVLFIGHVQDPTMAPPASSYMPPPGGC